MGLPNSKAIGVPIDLYVNIREFLRLPKLFAPCGNAVKDFHASFTVSSVPGSAWDRTAFEAPASDSAGRACSPVGSQAGAWEPESFTALPL